MLELAGGLLLGSGFHSGQAHTLFLPSITWFLASILIEFVHSILISDVKQYDAKASREAGSSVQSKAFFFENFRTF